MIEQPAADPPSRLRLFTSIAAALIALATLLTMGKDLVFPSAPQTPLVMIMDSAHPARIYDDSIRDNGGTNADILSDILDDLPVRTQKELISPSWHRYESITKFEPDLIVIHYSGFKQEDASGPRPQLKLLIEYFLKTDTEFLVYSRASERWLDEKMTLLLGDLPTAYPSLRERVEIFPLLQYGEPYWQDQNTAQSPEAENQGHAANRVMYAGRWAALSLSSTGSIWPMSLVNDVYDKRKI